MDPRVGLRRLRGLLSDRPERVWPDAIVHHGGRAVLLVALAFAIQLLFPVVPVPDFPVLEKGMVADEDIIARVAFPINKTEPELAREREEAAAAVPPVFQFREQADEIMSRRVDAFLARIDTAAAAETEEARAQRIREVLRAHGFIGDVERPIELLSVPQQRRVLERALERVVAAEVPEGIAMTSELEESGAASLRILQGERERIVSRDSVPTQLDLFERAAIYLPRNTPEGLQELQRLILIFSFEPSLRLDAEATEAARERARQAVPTVKGQVLQGERIVAAHEQVQDDEVERLTAYRRHLATLGQLEQGLGGGPRAIGSFLYALLLLTIFGLLLYFFRPAVYHEGRHVFVIALLVLTLAGLAAAIGHNDLPDELIPIAIPALVVAALWDGRMALNLALVLALLVGGQAPFGGISVLFTLAVAGAAAALSVRVVRRRAQTWYFVMLISAAYFAAAITLGLLRSRELTEILWSAGWGTLNAIGSALIAMGFLPLLESFTRITTDQTLLELSDLNHPLMRRLSREAPGTFSHSLSVANLAESAAHAIGANALLARVGIYYHDVGKIAKPQYFIENQPAGRNPHDKLKPGSSASIVRNHVIEGLRLADEHGLPDCIRDFVAEHHGTQSISFFYERARQLDPDAELDESAFAYPGPRPRSKETAIAMLADSVESATRALPDPTPDRIRELVDRIVAGKIRAGQLDDAPLTLRELTDIKAAFTSILTGMYHHRIDYPTAPEKPKTVEEDVTATAAAAATAAAGDGAEREGS